MEPTKLAKRIASKKEVILKRTLIIGAAIGGLLVAVAVVSAVKADEDILIIEGDDSFTVIDNT